MGGRCRRPVGEDEAHADQHHERGHDQRAEAEPERIVLEVGRKDAVEAKVEREVVDEHQAERAAAQGVDAIDPRRAGPRQRRRDGGRCACKGLPSSMLAAHRNGTRQSTRQPPPSGGADGGERPLELRLVGAPPASAASASARPSRAVIVHSTAKRKIAALVGERPGDRVAVGL